MKKNPYLDFVLGIPSLRDNTLDLTEECNAVRRAWLRAMKDVGLHVGIGGRRQQIGNQGRICLAWFTGLDDQIYYVIFDVSGQKVTNEVLK